MAESNGPEQEATRRQRSPQHPAFSLKEAIDKARTLHEKEGTSMVGVSVGLAHWGYTPKSSSGLRALATMDDFGLIVVDGTGEKKRIGISDLGRLLVRHPDRESTEYRLSLRAAAIGPKIHQEVLEHFNAGLPSDDALAWELERHFGFLPGSIPAFIAELRETFAFAKLDGGDTIDEKRDPQPSIMRLWEGGLGALNPPKPRPGMKQEVFSLAEGDVVLQWPAEMSAGSYADFKDWLKLIERKAGRAVREPGPEDPGPTEPCEH